MADNNKVMTLDEFLQSKAEEVRNEAYNKSKTRKKGVEIRYDADENSKLLNELIISDHIYDGNRMYSPPRQGEEAFQGFSERDIANYNQAVKETENNCDYGLNCIATATDNYPDGSRTIVNKDFADRYEELGFKEVSMEEALPGDIVQQINENGPYHGMIFNGFDEHGNPTFNYSSGGIEEGHYVVGGQNYSPKYKVYRYIGTPELIEQWTNEYNSSSNNTNVEQKRLGGMKKCRKKKFIGGALNAVGSVASAGINAAAQTKMAQMNVELGKAQIQSQKEMSNRQNASAYLSNMNRFANQDMEGFYDKYKPQFKCGGKVRFKANLGKFKDRN